MITLRSNKKTKKTLNLVTKIIVNKTCQPNIIKRENSIPIYHKLLLLLNLHDSHIQKNLCFFPLNIESPTI